MPSKKASEVPQDPPTSIDPYTTLSIDKDATEEQVKKAYRRAALKHHPDKATGDDAATAHADFQKVAFAYAILSDPKRRKRYNATGSTSESIGLDDDDFDWDDFFRSRYQEVTTEAIESFTKSYKASDEERQAVLAAYKKGKGNMDIVYEMVMASNVLEDDERFRAIIDEAITKQEVQAYDKYTKETEKSKEHRVKRAEREAKEAEVEEAKQAKKKATKTKKGGVKKADEESSLAAIIQQRQKARGHDFLDDLAAKYVQVEGPKGRKRRAEEEPPEEAFVAMAERAERQKRGRK